MIPADQHAVFRRFAWIYALANLGVYIGFAPALSLLIPRRVSAIDPSSSVQSLSVVILVGAAVASAVTLKSDYVRVSPLPDAPTALTSLAGWIGDYNHIHPHSGLKMRSPREHRALISATA